MCEHARSGDPQSGEAMRTIHRNDAVADHDVEAVVIRIQRAYDRISRKNRGGAFNLQSSKQSEEKKRQTKHPSIHKTPESAIVTIRGASRPIVNRSPAHSRPKQPTRYDAAPL